MAEQRPASQSGQNEELTDDEVDEFAGGEPGGDEYSDVPACGPRPGSA